MNGTRFSGKRILAMLVAVCLTVGMLPMTAAALNNGSYMSIGADIA